jgi:hypothetical protein
MHSLRLVEHSITKGWIRNGEEMILIFRIILFVVLCITSLNIIKELRR